MPLPDGLESTFNSQTYLDLRKKALNGEKISGCSKCYEQEENGIPSLRESANKRLPKSIGVKVPTEDINYLELFVGDVCNLKCLTCNPQLSTTWRKDYEQLNWPMPSETEQMNIEPIFDQLKNLREIKFVGGEPLLSKQHSTILDRVSESNFPNQISLTYFTNATVWPEAQTIEYWKKFKEIILWLSVDGFESVNEYIRFPSKWNKVCQTVNKFLALSAELDNIRLRIMTTVSVYNVWSLQKLERWFEQLKNQNGKSGLEYIHFNPLINPSHLSTLNLPNDWKKAAISGLGTDSEVQFSIKRYMTEKESDFDSRLIDYTKKLDEIRGVHIRNYIPELEGLIYS